MMVAIVAAMDRRRLIGAGNRLPWHLPADLRHFKALTLGKPIIMGRRTWDSLGRPLPGRQNVVITRNRAFPGVGCTVVHDLDESLEVSAGHPEVMIISGATLYREALPLARRMYLTLIDADYEGDTWFPEYPAEEWAEVSGQAFPAGPETPAYRFVVLERVSAV